MESQNRPHRDSVFNACDRNNDGYINAMDLASYVPSHLTQLLIDTYMDKDQAKKLHAIDDENFDKNLALLKFMLLEIDPDMDDRGISADKFEWAMLL